MHRRFTALLTAIITAAALAAAALPVSAAEEDSVSAVQEYSGGEENAETPAGNQEGPEGPVSGSQEGEEPAGDVK